MATKKSDPIPNPHGLAFTVSADTLRRETRLLARIADPNAPIAALSGILLEGTVREDGTGVLTLQATDLQVEATLTLPGATIVRPGKVRLPAHRLEQALQRQGGSTIEVDTNPTRCRIRCGEDSVAELHPIADDLEAQLPVPAGEAHPVEGGKLIRLFDLVRFAGGRARETLDGIAIQPKPTGLLGYATDTHHLGAVFVETTALLCVEEEDVPPIVIASDSARLTRTLLEALVPGGADAQVAWDAGVIGFRIEDRFDLRVATSTRKLPNPDAVFLATRNALRAGETGCTVSLEALQTAFARSAAVCGSLPHEQALSLTLAPDGLTVAGTSAGIGTTRERIAAFDVQGERVLRSVFPHQIETTLAFFGKEADKVRIRVPTDLKRPLLFTCPDRPEQRAYVMPVLPLGGN